MRYVLLLVLAVALIVSMSPAQDLSVVGRFGLSDFSNGGGVGLQIGGGVDYGLKHDLLLGSEFNINTQGGGPIEWGNYVKYMIDLPSSKVKPYIDGGFNLWFYTGGPYFGLRFGGGIYFPVTPQISIPADIQLGPVFTSGSSTFYFAMTSGIRYTLP
ncbi:MAG TPA: hypothetical protein VMW43_02075 [Bacteroidota bacterium]|nr:hypothetical protein [Bacteroidota bacterium]